MAKYRKTRNEYIFSYYFFFGKMPPKTPNKVSRIANEMMEEGKVKTKGPRDNPINAEPKVSRQSIGHDELFI